MRTWLSTLDGLVVYPLRTLPLPAAAAYVTYRQFVSTLANGETVGPWDRMLALAAGLDVFHSLFYAGLIAAAFFVFAPRWGEGVSAGRRKGWLAAAFGAGVALLLGLAPLYTRVAPPFRPEFVGLCAWAGLNAGLFAWAHHAGWWTARRRRVVKGLVGVADFVVPMLVWETYRDGVGRWFNAWRPWPAMVTAVLPILPWLISPVPPDVPLRQTDVWRWMEPGNLQQVIVDPRDGAIITVAELPRSIERLNPTIAPATVEATLALPREAGNTQALAWDWKRGRLISVNLPVATTYVIDARTLAVTATLPIADAPKVWYDSPCRTELFPATQGLYAFCPEGLYRLCEDGEKIEASAFYSSGALVFDEQRRETIMIAWLADLLFFRDDPLRISRYVGKPHKTERAVVDAVKDRLIAGLPIEGELMVMNLGDLSWRRITAFPGARIPDLFAARRWLLVTGLSSVLEVRDADSLRLRGRFAAPPWARSLAIDEARHKAYVATAYAGVWQIDLDELGAGWVAGWIARMDPFYVAANLGAAWVRRVVGWHDEVATMPPFNNVEPRPGVTCDGPPWYTRGD